MPNADRQSRAVIFDVDGVLVDSYRAHLESWVALAREDDVAFTERDFAATFGQRSRDVIRRFWPAHAHAEPRISSIDDRKEALFRELISAEFPAMPGAVGLLGALHAEGFRVAVGSSGPPENVSLVIDRLSCAEKIDASVTGVDVTRGKPDPEVFLIAAAKLGVSPDRCAVVEDAPAGIEAARAAGMAAIGLVSTGRTRTELARADRVVTSLAELTPESIAALIERSRATGPQPDRDRSG